MRRLGIYTPLLLTVIAFAVPRMVFGAGFPVIIPQGGVCDCDTAPAYGCVLEVIQNLVTVGVWLGVTMCVVWLAYAGFMLMASGGNPEALSQAKTRIVNALVGIVVILCAWITVDFLMKAIYEPDRIFQGNNFGPWNSILAPSGDDYCIKATTPTALTTGSLDILFGGSAGTTAGLGGGGGGGTCQVQSAGLCAQSNFTAAFGAAASEASQVCSAESANGTQQRGDKTTEGNPVSFGLFQINTTVHKVAGLNCPAAYSGAYTGSNKNIKIVNPSLYVKCRDAALVASNNIAVAASIYKGDKGSWRQWSTRAKCGLSQAETLKLASIRGGTDTCYE